MPKVTKVRRGRVRGGTCSSYSSCPYSRTSWRDCPKSPRGVHHSALRASETMLFGPFWPPYTGQIHAQSVDSTLFGQSLSLCERLAGLWLRPCYVRSLPAHFPLCALPRRVVAGNLDAFAIP